MFDTALRSRSKADQELVSACKAGFELVGGKPWIITDAGLVVNGSETKKTKEHAL
ncbi:MAG: hypothetical protein ACREDR_34450 [Blastocatellia bacterium]